MGIMLEAEVWQLLEIFDLIIPEYNFKVFKNKFEFQELIYIFKWSMMNIILV